MSMDQLKRGLLHLLVPPPHLRKNPMRVAAYHHDLEVENSHDLPIGNAEVTIATLRNLHVRCQRRVCNVDEGNKNKKPNHQRREKRSSEDVCRPVLQMY